MRGPIVAVIAVGVAVAVPSALAQNGAGAKAMHVTENEWGISGVPAKVQAGAELRITVTNRGGVLHELVLEHGGCAKQCAVKIGGKNAELENLAPGTSRSAIWTITKPGIYTFTCRKPGHWKAGMRRTFTVS